MNQREKTIKRKNYNIKFVVPLSTIPLEDRNKALKDFAEGSFGLKQCLGTMWMKGLNTIACCPGRHGSYNSGYITMEPGVDLFSYLSNETLENGMVKLWISYGRHVVGFAGTRKKRERILLQLQQDIISGKKDNSEEVFEKLCQNYPTSYLVKKKQQELIDRGMSGETLMNELYKYFNKCEKDAKEKRIILTKEKAKIMRWIA